MSVSGVDVRAVAQLRFHVYFYSHFIFCVLFSYSICVHFLFYVNLHVHVHVLFTQHLRAAWTCRRDMQHGDLDMKHGQAALACTMGMQH